MLSVVVVSVGMAIPAAAANLPLPTPPFNQCPAIGLSPSCAVLVVQNADGSVVTLVDGSVGPFDGIEDTLIGFQNNSGSTVSSLPLSGSGSLIPPFSFDGDGICSGAYGTWNGSAGCPYLDTQFRYGGPGVTFSNISLDFQSATVNFSPAILDGGSAYFSLEGPSASIAPPTKASPVITTQATDGALGGTISDTATLTGGNAPTGTITFNLFGPNNPGCTLLAFTSTTPVSGSGSTSDTFTPALLGTYLWVATYGGDGNNNSANTVCGASGETSTVTKASPAIATSATATATVGGTISDTATLSGGIAPTGTITFNVFGPNDATCTLPAVFTSTNPVSGNSATSDTFAPLLPGTYLWVATYNGDANNKSVSTACGATEETSVVGLLFAPGGGSFVIGDKNAVTCTAKGGCTVTFWGAQWWKLNSLTHGPAPASFKGFAESPNAPSCSSTNWSADTGNSTPPPVGPLPAFMGVIVTSNASQSGSTDSGNIVHIVVVQTNPGYQPDPGHPGTGTVVAVVC
jgi:hypothetical protein